MHEAIGIDVGGTKIAGGVVTVAGQVLAEHRIPTVADDPRAIVEAVTTMVRTLAAGREITAVGVAVAGFVDLGRSVIRSAPNIAWRDEPLRDELAGRLGVDVVIENDANAAGWAEYRFGAGREIRDMTMLTIGTGVGGAIVSGGQLLRGGFGAGGELGHLRVVPDGLPCGCGARGCIEQYGSGRALLRMAGELADLGGIGHVLAEARREHGMLDGGIVAGLISAGDPGAVHVLRTVGGWLGQACASISAVLDPQRFVFGGGVSIAEDLLLDPVREAYRTHVRASGALSEPDFVTAELVNDAGVVGAADLARVNGRG